METTSSRPAGSVFSLEGVPPAGQLVPLGLQHVVAAIVAIALNLLLPRDRAVRAPN